MTDRLAERNGGQVGWQHHASEMWRLFLTVYPIAAVYQMAHDGAVVGLWSLGIWVALLALTLIVRAWRREAESFADIERRWH